MARAKGSGRTRYCMWKGDDLLAIGTAEELAAKFGVKVDTIRFYASGANKRRDRGNRRVCERL